MKKLTACFLLLALLCAAAWADVPTRVHYVPVPDTAFGGREGRVLAATPDGHRLLLYTSDAIPYIWDTQTASRIPLTFEGQEDVFDKTARQFAHNAYYALYMAGGFYDAEQHEQWKNDYDARVSVLTGGGKLQTLEQLAVLLPLAEFHIWFLDMEESHVLLMNEIGLFVADLTNGSCRLFTGTTVKSNSILAGEKAFVGDGGFGFVQWDWTAGDIREVPVDDRCDGFDRMAGWVSPDGDFWISGGDSWYPTNEEEVAEYSWRFANITRGDEPIRVRIAEAFRPLYAMVRNFSEALYTSDGAYVLVYDTSFRYAFVVVNLGTGDSAWFKNVSAWRATDLPDGPCLTPLTAADGGFVCYDLDGEQMVLLDPQTGGLTPLSFYMRSEELPMQYREIGSVGTRTGEIWTTITTRMIKNAYGSRSGMVFADLPGYFVVE